MRLRFARKNNATIQWLMSFMAVWNKRVDGFHTPFQTRLDDYMIFGGFHNIGIQHHCQAPTLLPLQNKMHNSSISQQTSPSHSDPCTVYLPTHLLDFYGKCSYRYTIRIQSYPYINPTGMRFTHFNLTIRQTLRAHFFGPWLSVVWPAALRGPVVTSSVGEGDFFSPQNSRGACDCSGDLAIWLVIWGFGELEKQEISKTSKTSQLPQSRPQPSLIITSESNRENPGSKLVRRFMITWDANA